VTIAEGLLEQESPVANEFRRIVFKLRRLLPERPAANAILVSSPMRMEGKTTAACYLATTFARENHAKVLLVDGDLRRPRVHEEMGVARKPGLKQLLAGEIGLGEAMQGARGLDSLSILASGGPSRFPSKYLRRELLSDLLSEAKRAFDLVVVDSPPLLPVSDPLVLAGVVDGFVLVVMAGKTPRQVFKRALGLLGDHRSKLLGVIVNNYERRLPYYYDYGYYGDHYGRGAPEAEETETR